MDDYDWIDKRNYVITPTAPQTHDIENDNEIVNDEPLLEHENIDQNQEERSNKELVEVNNDNIEQQQVRRTERIRKLPSTLDIYHHQSKSYNIKVNNNGTKYTISKFLGYDKLS